MADISRLSRLVAGIQRHVDLQSNALVVGSLKVGSTSPVELTKTILTNLIALQDGTDFSNGTNSHTHDGRYYTETEMGSTSNGEGASLVGIEDASSYYTGTNVEAALDEMKDQIGGLTSSTFTFAEANVLANNDAVYAALDKLDLRWGDLGSTANGEGASLVGLEDAAGYYTGANLEAILIELKDQIGGLTSATFNFSENNVLADNDSIYAALEKTDLKFGDLASTANGEGASLIGIEDAAGNFTGTTVETALVELNSAIASSAAGINMKDAVRVATAAALPTYTYANGTGGVGATITADANGALPSIDGQALSVSDRILVKDGAAALDNGIYVVTDLGSAGTPWVLTRATDFDDSPDGEVKGGNLVYVQEGTDNANTQFILQGNADDKIIGTSPLNWSVFSRAEAIVAGTGLSKTGLTLSVDYSTAGAIGAAIEASALASTANGEGASMIGIEDVGGLISATTVEGALVENRTAIDAIEDNTITSPNGSISVAGTVGADDQTVDVEFSTAGAANRSIEASALASTSTGEGASMVGIEDSGSLFTATTVEGALAELASAAADTEALTSDETPNVALGTGLRAVRYGITGLDTPENAGELYLADPTELSLVASGGNKDPFHVVGLVDSDNTTGAQKVYRKGLMTVTGHGFAVGEPIWLDAAGVATNTAPSAAGEASVKLGMAKDANTIDVDIHIMGVN